MTIIERIDWMLGQSSNDEFVNRPLETYYMVKDLIGAVKVKTPSGKIGFKPKTEEEMTI